MDSLAMNKTELFLTLYAKNHTNTTPWTTRKKSTPSKKLQTRCSVNCDSPCGSAIMGRPGGSQVLDIRVSERWVCQGPKRFFASTPREVLASAHVPRSGTHLRNEARSRRQLKWLKFSKKVCTCYETQFGTLLSLLLPQCLTAKLLNSVADTYGFMNAMSTGTQVISLAMDTNEGAVALPAPPP